MPTIFLRWDDNNHIEQGYHVYRSRDTIDTTNPPTPIATMPRKAVRYVDDDAYLISGVKYYYCVGAYIDDLVMFSDIIEFIPSDNMVYAITTDNKLVQFHEGNVVWVEDVGETLEHIFISDENYIYVSTTSNKVHVYDAFSRELKQTLSFPQRIIGIEATFDHTKIIFNGNGGTAFVLELPSLLTIFDIVYGAGTSNFRFAQPSIDKIYVGNSAISIFQYDFQGTQQWSVNVVGTTRGMVVVPDGVVYGDDAIVIKLDTTGNELWRYSMPTIINNIASDAYGNVTVGSGSTVYRLDRHGVLEWTTSVSTTPSDIQKDISGAPYVVASSNINILSSEGDIRTTITEEMVRRVSLSLRGNQPDVITPHASVIYDLSTNVVGVEENTTIANAGVVGIGFNVTHDPVVSEEVSVHGSEYEVIIYQFNVAHEPVATGQVGE